MDNTFDKKLKIGDLEAKYPIVQGGMGVGISLSNLASAVAEQGGIGVIATAGIGTTEKDYKTNFKKANKRKLRQEIRKAKSKTDGIIGINIMIALTDYAELAAVAVEEKADIIFLGAGLPLRIPETMTIEQIKKVKTKFIPIVSSPKAVKLIFSRWKRYYDHIPDGVVVEGPMAGGHLGFKREELDKDEFSLENLLKKIIPLVRDLEKEYGQKIPIIAGGGIFTGSDIYKYLSMGVDGVQMGTRFVATEECDADIKFKEAYLKAKKEDVKIIESPVGLPGRAISNKFLEEVSEGERKPFVCPWKCLRTCKMNEAPYCIAKALINAKSGRLDDGFAFAGKNVYRVNEIISVKELFNKLKFEYKSAKDEIRPEKSISSEIGENFNLDIENNN